VAGEALREQRSDIGDVLELVKRTETALNGIEGRSDCTTLSGITLTEIMPFGRII